MSKTVNSAFTKFLNETVNLNPNKTSIARKSRDNLINNIANFSGNNDFFTVYSEKNLKFGSFARKTKIRELDDIDLMLCLSAEGTCTYTESASCIYIYGDKHRLTMVNTPLNKALGVRNQIFHSKETRSAVAWTWERMMSATCRRSSKSMLSQFPRWEDKYSIFCGETLSAFSAAISFISP